jgi:hypothetical protein
MKRSLPVLIIVVTVVLVAAGSVRFTRPRPTTPDRAVQAMFAYVKARDWNRAFDLVANAEKVDRSDFISDLQGRDASLRTYSALEKVDTSVLHESDSQALVRTVLVYSSAVGPLEDTRDLGVIREGEDWKVIWPVQKQPKVPPQVIPVNYLRWDVIYRGAGDDWGAQDAAPPKVRITSMNAIAYEGGTIVMGELVNDDTVPGFVAVNATLIGSNNEVLGEETAFDKISHTLLPKQVSPFRIDFPRVPLAEVKSVRMSPNAMLVPASADPVIGAVHQQLTKDAFGKTVLKGELLNQSGETVNIPHVLATFYDNSGKVIWVSEGYVSSALLPQIPLPFAVVVASDVAPHVQSYRVSVNQYMLNRRLEAR